MYKKQLLLFSVMILCCAGCALEKNDDAIKSPAPTQQAEQDSPTPTGTVQAVQDYFAAYNGEKLQRMVSKRGDNYSPATCDDIIFYYAEDGETIEEVLAAMKTAMLEPLTVPSEERPYTVTSYDVTEQKEIIELEQNMWCLPFLEGSYKFDGVDLLSMEERLKFEELQENGLLPFERQGSSGMFQFILLKENNVYRLQRLEKMCEITPELQKYMESD